MKLWIDPRIFERFPGITLGVIEVSGMDNKSERPILQALLRDEEARQREVLQNVELTKLPEIRAWREIYRAFGSDPHDYRSSVEALLRRVRAGNKPLPSISPLVDLYNYISLKYRLPVGAEDLDRIEGDIALTFANGTEQGITLGSKETETCYDGEVVYRDEQGFICRRWNWREADRTKIEPTTSRAVVIVEKVRELSEDTLQNALVELEQRISAELAANCRRFELSSSCSTCELL